jgi:hypothetical protein
MVTIDQQIIEEIKAETKCTVDIKHDNLFSGIIIKDYLLPTGLYNVNQADLLIIIPNGYPRLPLDMFFTYPILKYQEKNTYPGQADVFCDFFGLKWQRWSRHYKWDFNKHNILTHLQVVLKCIEKGDH